MRKLKAIFSLIAIVLLLAGGIFSVYYFAKDDENKKIVVTTFPIYDICVNILGNADEVMILQDNGVDMHSYQPTVQDITAINNAELFIYIGGHSDDWVGDVIRSADNVNLKDLPLINYVDKLHESSDNIISKDEHHHENEEEHEHNSDCEFDEHIWLSLKNMIKMTEIVLDKLIDVFPHMEQLLTENANLYIEKLNDLDTRYTEVCENNDTIIVMADRFPFLYLSYDYELNFVAAFSGCSTDSEASTEVIANLINYMNSNNLNNICILETSNGSVAESVIKDLGRGGVDIVVFNSCQSVISNNIGSMSYLNIMENNLKSLEKVLKNENN